MIILVDTSEEASAPKVVAQLRKNFSQVIVTNLPHRNYGGTNITSGDINIPLDSGHLLAIERKTPEDFLGSIANRHLFNQVEVMANNAQFSAIIVTGTITYNRKDEVFIDGEKRDGWHASSVEAAILAIEYSSCPIIFCPPDEYSMKIVSIYNQVNKPPEHQGVVKNRLITFPPVDARVEFLAQLPGIQLTLADRLLKKAGEFDEDADIEGYGSLVGALQYLTIMLTIDKSSRPAGWGTAKVLSLRKFFGLAEDQYIGKVRETTYARGGKSLPAVEINGTIYVKTKEL